MSKRKFWIRLAVVGVLIAVAATAFAYAIGSLLSTESGYRTIECTANGANCSSEFVFTYNVGASEMSPNAELKAVTNLYNEKAVYYYRLFHPDELFDGLANVASLNVSPNTAQDVPPELYSALEVMAEDETRSLFLGPVYAYYETLFSSSYDEDAATWDPSKNMELALEYVRILSFASDPEMISLELAGGHAKLVVSDEYLSYANEIGISRFIDFSWLKNAFIADRIASDMKDAGFVHGALSSVDGFISNFDLTSTEYAYDVYIDQKDGVKAAGRLVYAGGGNICSLHPFILSEDEKGYYYEYEDGERVTRYISSADGLPHGKSSTAILWSRGVSCADMALSALPFYLADNACAFTSDSVGFAVSDGGDFTYKSIEGFELKE